MPVSVYRPSLPDESDSTGTRKKIYMESIRKNSTRDAAFASAQFAARSGLHDAVPVSMILGPLPHHVHEGHG